MDIALSHVPYHDPGQFGKHERSNRDPTAVSQSWIPCFPCISKAPAYLRSSTQSIPHFPISPVHHSSRTAWSGATLRTSNHPWSRRQRLEWLPKSNNTTLVPRGCLIPICHYNFWAHSAEIRPEKCHGNGGFLPKHIWELFLGFLRVYLNFLLSFQGEHLSI